MKKFSKMLALGLALVLTMGMTVSAAENSENTSNSNAATEALTSSTSVGSVEINGKTVTFEFSAASAESLTKVESVVEALANEGCEGIFITGGEIPAPANLTAEEIANGVTVPLSNPNISKDKTYVVLHVLTNGDVEVLPATVVANGSLTFVTKSFSPFYVVEMKEIDEDDDDDDAVETVTVTGEVASPKTGETLPVAGMMLVICLAGAAVCAKKARYNN